MRNARTGSDFPLTEKGSSGAASKASFERSTADSVAHTSPGAAFPMTRAARFTASPLTE